MKQNHETANIREITDVKEIQKIALDILVYIDKVCRENNIKYSIAGGTLLGAVRHKGFIPWDDDIDIVMLREDYDRFLEIMDNTPSTKYKALHFGKNFPNYAYTFTKVVDLDTRLFEFNTINNPDLGVFVDVFPIDKIPENNADRIIKKDLRMRSFIWNSASVRLSLKNKNLIKKVLKPFLFTYSKLMGHLFWLKKHDKFLRNLNKIDTKKGYCFCGAYAYKDYYDIDWFDNLIDLEFEGHKFLAFSKWHDSLTRLYNNYMELPPVEKRISHHDFKIFKR